MCSVCSLHIELLDQVNTELEAVQDQNKRFCVVHISKCCHTQDTYIVMFLVLISLPLYCYFLHCRWSTVQGHLQRSHRGQQNTSRRGSRDFPGKGTMNIIIRTEFIAMICHYTSHRFCWLVQTISLLWGRPYSGEG